MSTTMAQGRAWGLLAAALLLADPTSAWRPRLGAVDGTPARQFLHLLTGYGAPRQPPSTGSAVGIRVTYLGTSGFLIEDEDDAVLLAPFFSHRGFFSLGLRRLDTDEALIDRQLQPLRDGLAKVWSVLVGHGHYDHLLDVPYIARVHCPQASVFGSRTVVNMIANEPGVRTAMPLNAMAEREPGGTGIWIHNVRGTMRFMAIASGHAPNFAGRTIATGTVDEELDTMPRRAGGLRMGEPLAYTIDFLHPSAADSVRFRIYFQDAAHSPETFHTLRRHSPGAVPIDLAIVCVAAFEQAPEDDYPEALVRVLAPRRLLLGHWESFFQDWTDQISQLRSVPQTDPRHFVERLQAASPEASWVMPIPGTSLSY